MERDRASTSLRAPAPAGPALLAWWDDHRRPLPWRRDRSPYRIWVAEVLLQQTRVAQAVPYYERLLRRYPSLRSLAGARTDELLKLWEGAGYYHRAWNLHATAQELVGRQGGRFPRTPAALEQLPGVGPYIARAIASLAFGVPVVALEANGLRVAARLTGERGDVRTAKVRQRLLRFLEHELPREAPGAFNEALMELGETVCTSHAPQCRVCPLGYRCAAFQTLADPGRLPTRRRRPPKPHHVAAIVALERGGRWLMQRRVEPGLLRGLWEFPGGRPEAGESLLAAARRELREETGVRAGTLRRVGIVHHAYSHFSVELHVYRGTLRRASPLPANARWLGPEDIRRHPLPRATVKALRLLGIGESLGRSKARPTR
ncbi:MAG: A/G-specific adenine glycosylase [Thermoplasmata archaeon]|nr:A/G-specific adenine glycosylase [Thermoplasmata archaeon]